jgi:mycofactocin glycosyltransferase
MSIRYVVDASWRRIPAQTSTDKDVIIAGSPIKVFRVSPAGRTIISALESGTDLPPNHEVLTSRLVSAGAIHPVSEEAATPTDITVVIPAFIKTQSQLIHLNQLIEMLAPLHVIIVDDASPQPITNNTARVIRHQHNMGPGAARNTGAHEVTTKYIAFVDTDCSVSSVDLCTVASHFADPSVGIVAPRVASIDDDSLIGQYEAVSSPLDMGNQPARIAPLSRVSYVPSAVVMVRTEAFHAIGGFLTTLRFGEDVDFVWRMIDNSWHCRYDPSVVCLHRNRLTFQDIARQRMSYGEAAAHLYMLHPDRLSPYVADTATTAAVTATALGFPLSALTAASISSTSLWRELHKKGIPPSDIARIIWMRFTHTAYMWCLAITRMWLPVFLVGALFSRRLRRVLLLAIVMPALWEYQRKNQQKVSVTRLPLMIALRAFDHGSYCAGAWKAMLKSRTLGPLIPRLSVRRSTSD